MAGRLSGKTAIVVGAGSIGPGWGNGKASAVLFAREGASVIAVDINEEAARETKAIIDAEGGACTVVVADIAVPDQVATMIADASRVTGRVDLLHANVGVVEIGGPVEISIENWDRLFAVNVRGVYLACKHVLPIMERQGGGSIITVSSLAAIRYAGFPQSSYAASKAALIGFTQNLALQYAAKGIRANCILPGLMNTPIVVKALTAAYGGAVDDMMKARDAQCPTGRMGDAWDVAHAALFLASDEARYVTGVALPVDGGLSLKW